MHHPFTNSSVAKTNNYQISPDAQSRTSNSNSKHLVLRYHTADFDLIARFPKLEGILSVSDQMDPMHGCKTLYIKLIFFFVYLFYTYIR